jgi:hypothetical protein
MLFTTPTIRQSSDWAGGASATSSGDVNTEKQGHDQADDADRATADGKPAGGKPATTGVLYLRGV